MLKKLFILALCMFLPALLQAERRKLNPFELQGASVTLPAKYNSITTCVRPYTVDSVHISTYAIGYSTIITGTSDITTTATSFTPMTDMAINLNIPKPANANVMFYAPVTNTNNGRIGYFRLAHELPNGTTEYVINNATRLDNALPVSGIMVTNYNVLPVGLHKWWVEWRVSANTIQQTAGTYGQRVLRIAVNFNK